MAIPLERLTGALKQRALELGFNRVGVLRAAPARRLDAYMRWIAEGKHGEMGYLARPDRLDRRRDPNIILPGVRSMVVVGLDYYTPPPPRTITSDPSRGRISNYAWGVDYHEIMTPRLEELAGWLRRESGEESASSRVYVDTGAILERDHGETAGFGFTGKNTLLIDPRRGSWFFLGTLLTALPLAYDPEPEEQPPVPGCGSCTRCLNACPTAAFSQPYVLDARRCISYLTIELKGWIPRELRPLMGNWVYGCDVCQEVCPFNRFARPTGEPAFYPVAPDVAAPPLLDILGLDDETFSRRFDRSPIKRIKRVRLVRNACVAAGNWGSPAAVPALLPLLADANPLVRGHAAWALHRIGGSDAVAGLRSALVNESDDDVRRELLDEPEFADHQQ
ncbi:MAG: tRNA epoxyqueuosine(34) reductase QueG [Anaerolineae bacterium]|nr:MAG: tRNA epoxyqueuosine(34) reductase QueG [Anaerolineae bacterium]